MRLVITTGLAIAAMAASVLYAARVQHTTATRHADQQHLTLDIRSDFNRGQVALATFALTGDTAAVDAFNAAINRLTISFPRILKAAAGDELENRAIVDQETLGLGLQAQVTNALAQPTIRAQRAALRATALARQEIADRMILANRNLERRQAVLAGREDRRAALAAPILIVLLGLVFGATAAVARRRTRRADARRERVRVNQERFGEAMQVSESQVEAHALLKNHVERSLAGVSVTVLNRNNSADRLEAGTVADEDSPLGQALVDARPRSCMAVRLNRPFHQGGDEVLSCAVCGVVPAETTCQPLLVGGEVIGAVLAEYERPPAAADRALIEHSVAQSAPVLANLRNLSYAETRAATDSLTGLPNRRAVDDTLLRLLAQAGRAFNPLSVIMLDLDHFKKINDTCGHDRGDEVLAAFATRLREVMRVSDFAGRSGGEEFVVFLPDTDRTGAVRLAEKVREQMRGLTVPGVEGAITASFGIAAFPDDALDADTLMRSADRALYAAKRNGRDRIESSSTGAPVPLARPAVA